MAQSSGPWSKGTDAQKQFTDVLWRDIFGGEPGIIQDYDGSAYKLTLPADSNMALVGSETIDSKSLLGGFRHLIPRNELEPLEIPPAGANDRTDVIALRYDPAWTGTPGPVKLVRIPGTEGGVSNYGNNTAPPGVEDLHLWAITRHPGKSLAQSTTLSLRQWRGGSMVVDSGGLPQAGVALGETARLGDVTYHRMMQSGQPAWVPERIKVQEPASVRRDINVAYSTPTNIDLGVFNIQRACYVTIQMYASIIIPPTSTDAYVYGKMMVDGAFVGNDVRLPYQTRGGQMGFIHTALLPAGGHVLGIRSFPNTSLSIQMVGLEALVSYFPA